MYRSILERNPAVRNANLLVVDDSEVSRTVIQKFFQEEDFSNIEYASDGESALKKIETFSPDLIIADIFMPNMNGYDFLKKLRGRKEFDHIPIIIQTSSTDAKDIAKAFDSGASDVISKPIQKVELLARTTFHLENVLFRKRIEKELQAARELQNSIVPSESDIESAEEKYDIQIASNFTPCSEIGGDFWGFKKISHGEFGVYTVDISGHGVAAALNTFRLQSILNDHNNFFSSTSIFLKKLNKRMVELMPIGQFATMFYGVINMVDNFIQYSSAASPGGIVIRKSGEIELLKASGFPLGIEASADYDLFETKFEPGDCLILYSDALIETGNKKGAFLTQDEINAVLSKAKDSSANEMLKELIKKFETHVGDMPITDDLTINIYKRL
jgi:sigma-B regulation protein RsbU (phosphoserine phosphatase)